MKYPEEVTEQIEHRIVDCNLSVIDINYSTFEDIDGNYDGREEYDVYYLDRFGGIHEDIFLYNNGEYAGGSTHYLPGSIVECAKKMKTAKEQTA